MYWLSVSIQTVQTVWVPGSALCCLSQLSDSRHRPGLITPQARVLHHPLSQTRGHCGVMSQSQGHSWGFSFVMLDENFVTLLSSFVQYSTVKNIMDSKWFIFRNLWPFSCDCKFWYYTNVMLVENVKSVRLEVTKEKGLLTMRHSEGFLSSSWSSLPSSLG